MRKRPIRRAGMSPNVLLPPSSLHVTRSATTGRGSTTAATRPVVNCTLASSASGPTTKPNTVLSVSSTSLLAARTLRHHQADYLSRFLLHHLSTTRPQFPHLRTLLSSPRTTIPDPGLSHPSPTSLAPSLSSTPCSSNPSVPTPSRFAFLCPLI